MPNLLFHSILLDIIHLLIPYYVEYKTPLNLRRIQFLNNFQREKMWNICVLNSK
jgi:hypothetical protein